MAFDRNNLKKKIAVWGTGNISKQFACWNADVMIDCFIDSDESKTQFLGKQIIHPSEIADWTEYFYIIAMVSQVQVKEMLISHGLTENIDYAGYVEFNEIDKTFDGCKNNLKELIEQYPEYRGAELIYAPIFTSRQGEMMVAFFNKYASASKDKIIFLCKLGTINSKNAEKLLGAPVIDAPDIFTYEATGKTLDGFCNEISGATENCISNDWDIDDIETTKICREPLKNRYIDEAILAYIQNIFDIVSPRLAAIWGGWTRKALLFEAVCQKMDIPYGFMEFGWLPGTIQFDRKGIGGRSEMVNSGIGGELSKEENDKIEQIKHLIIDKKMDTGIFTLTDYDAKQIDKLIPDRKTVFFVGMGDDGMKINPESQFWNDYVSELFSSTRDAADYLYHVCRENGWNFIFKPHPKEDAREEYESWGEREDFILVRNYPIDELIDLADVVVSMASAVDFKVIMKDKPLVHIGNSAMKGCGCDRYASKRDDIKPIIAEEISGDKVLERKANINPYFSRLLKTCLWDDMTQRDIRYGRRIDECFIEL